MQRGAWLQKYIILLWECRLCTGTLCIEKTFYIAKDVYYEMSNVKVNCIKDSLDDEAHQ